MSRFNLERFILQDLPEDDDKLKILFVGSGGSLNELIKKHFGRAQITTIDIDPKRMPDVVMDVMQLGFSNDTFDLVFALEVLEHVTDPRLAVSNLYNVLKPGGKVVVSTPFILGIHDEPYDFYRYTKYGLLCLFRDFNNIKVFARTGLFSAAAILISRVISGRTLYEKIFGSILTLVIFPFFWIGLFLDRFVSESVTTGYVLHASK